MIDCPECAARLADRAATEDAEVRSHLESCADCCKTKEAIETLAKTAFSPSAGTLDRLAARVKTGHAAGEERARRGAPVRTAFLAGAFAAAGAAAVALVLEFAFPAPHRTGEAPNPPAQEMAEAAAPDVDDFLSPAEADELADSLVSGDEVASLEDDWADNI